MKNQKGFLLISLLIVVAIIAILFVVSYTKPGSGGKSVQQTGQTAIEQTKQNNATLIEQQQQQIQMQNDINSIGQ